MLATRRRHLRLPSDGVFSTRSTTNSKFSTFRTNKIPIGMTTLDITTFLAVRIFFFLPIELRVIGSRPHWAYKRIDRFSRTTAKSRTPNAAWTKVVWMFGNTTFDSKCAVWLNGRNRLFCVYFVYEWTLLTEISARKKKKCRSTLTILKKKKRACRVNRCTSCYRRGLPNTSSNSTQKYYPKLTDVS